MGLQDHLLSVPQLQMEWHVSCACGVMVLVVNQLISSSYSVDTIDYTGVADVPLMFEVGDLRVCYDVEIIDDTICELESIEDFFANLAYVSGEQPIIIDPEMTRVIINDTAEPECGKLTYEE